MKRMASSENQQIEISKNLEQLNHKINFLQDAMLKIQSEFSVMRKSENKGKTNSQLFFTANKDKLHFLEKRSSECKIADACSFSLEKGIYDVMKTFNEEGAEKSLKYIDLYLKRMSKSKCDDIACLKNYIVAFRSLKELISDSQEAALRYVEEISILNKDSIFEDGVEDEIYHLLTPLSNKIRLKIMYDLREGGKSYSQLENQTGIKAGHLGFHLEKLIKGGYMMKEKKNYILTINGLKVLKFLFELRSELLLTSQRTSKGVGQYINSE